MMEVSIILGSRSDLPVADKATKVFDEFDINYELRIASAHRAPKYLEGIVDAALENGCRIFIGIAGVSAALPGVLASMTNRPVIGVPVGGKVPMDSLLSIVQMPPGMPVATVGVDRGENAALLAIQILANSNEELAASYATYRDNMTEKVIGDDQLTNQERE
jgi:5-(carboxyamino)imidazole ribonucleotide mutase